jgi:hypothetical protein
MTFETVDVSAALVVVVVVLVIVVDFVIVVGFAVVVFDVDLVDVRETAFEGQPPFIFKGKSVTEDTEYV